MDKKITIALAGNPNSGKTTIFNNLTGMHQHVGNYPGVTVEKIEGALNYKEYEINIVDLPGTYSLSAYTMDEIITRNFLLEKKIDVVIDIIDTSNLERNLYLATQLMELGIPLILAFNMYDLAKKGNFSIDKNKLSELLGMPIVFTIAPKQKGMNELLDNVIDLIEGKIKFNKITVSYGREIDEEIEKINNILRKDASLIEKYPIQWLAIKLLEGDKKVFEEIKSIAQFHELFAQVQASIQHLQGIFGDAPEAVIADRRYGFISGACSEALKKTYEVRHTISDKIDKVLVNKILGLPILFTLMWLVFKATFAISAPFMAVIEKAQGYLSNLVSGFFSQGSVIQSLVTDGIIGGVGSVLVFVPIIFMLFLAMALLEDSGYMARAAFIMDNFMHKIGLHGRSFIPMLLGFSCNVPAIIATRTIEDKRDRFVTILVNPFMSCGARLPIYTLLIGAFFSQKMAGNVLFSIYILGIAVAAIMAKIFRKHVFKGEATAFVMELPPYRIPTIKGLLTHTWERGSVYLKKAGTVIVLASIVVWFLSSFPRAPMQNQTVAENLEKSYIAKAGKAVAPVFKPLGFGDWKIATGLIGGVFAKEIVVSTLGTLYSTEENSRGLRSALRDAKRTDGNKLFTPLVAYSMMIFVLLYIPCMATIAIIKRETKSWFWAGFAAVYTTAVAWLVSFIIYQGGRLLGLG